MINDKGFFETPEFRELFNKYEQMKAQNICSYYETNELNDILSYYLYFDKPEEVEKVYNLARRLHPDSPETVKMHIRILLTYGKAESAIHIFDTIAYDGDDDTMLLKAETLLAIKDYKGAQSIAQEILKRNLITDEIAYDALEILLDCGYAQDVLEISSKGLRQNPGNRNLLEVAAESFIELQKTDEAIEIYNKLLDETPYSTFYWEQLGHIYYLIERYSKALECFEYELTIDNSIEYAYIMQGYCYYNLKAFDKAHKIFKCIADRHRESIEAEFYTTLSEAMSGKIAAAIAGFEKIFKDSIAKSNGSKYGIEAVLSLVNMAILWSRQGNDEVSCNCMKQAMHYIDLCDNTEQFITGFRCLCELRDKDNMTFEDMNRIGTKDWKQHETLTLLGARLLSAGYESLAIYPLYKARSKAPDCTEIDAYIAFALYRTKGDWNEFNKMLSNAIEGKSDKLFTLFDIPYRADITVDDFIDRALLKQ